MVTISDDKLEAVVFVIQSYEWMHDCPHKNRCPGARLYTHLKVLFEENERLKSEIKTYNKKVLND